jgi:hypothetical protein
MQASILLLFILIGYENPVWRFWLLSHVAVAYLTVVAVATIQSISPALLLHLPTIAEAHLSTFIIITITITMARERRIELLTEDNFDTWIIDACVLLCKQKL